MDKIKKYRLAGTVGGIVVLGIAVWYFFIRTENFGPVEMPAFFPDDPELNTLWDEYREAVDYRAMHGESPDDAIKKTTKALIEGVFERRMRELAQYQSPVPIKPFGEYFSETPALDGSSSCISLAAIIRARALGSDYEWTNSLSNTYGQERLLSIYFDNPEKYSDEIDFPISPLGNSRPWVEPPGDLFYFSAREAGINSPNFSGTHESYVRLIKAENPAAMLILVARTPSESENELATSAGIELECTPFALDGFVFIANRRNPVDNLSLQQIRDIYTYKYARTVSKRQIEQERRRAFESGEISNGGWYGASLRELDPEKLGTNGSPVVMNWKHFGGPNRFLTIYERPVNSGSRELMDSLVMGENRTVIKFHSAYELAPFSNLIYSMTGLIDAVRSNPWGLGYSLCWYEQYMLNSPSVKVLSINGMRPDYESIRTGKYPLISPVYLVTHKNIAPDSKAVRFRDWILSPDGQRAIKESGYVPINPEIAAEK